MNFKQVPTNLGNYVVVNDDASGATPGYVWTYACTDGARVPTLTSGVPIANKDGAGLYTKGTLFKDLGITYVDKIDSASMQNVYRKVVHVSAASGSAPTEVFIKVVNAKKGGSEGGSDDGKVQFARLG